MLIYIYGTDYKGLSSMGTGEIAIVDRVYRVGYWGSARNIAMMAEIRSVLASINPKVSDGSRFAAEYMEHNGQLRSNGEPHFVLDISENNPVIYLEADEVVNKLESGTGIINLGFPICPWCREIIPHLIELAEQNDMPLYYMNIQSIRDVLELDESGGTITTTKGTPEYHRMVEILYDWLWEYAGLESPEIKRIYVPTTIFVKDGEILYVHIATLRENYEGGYKPLDNPQLERVQGYLNDAMMQVLNNTNNTDSDCNECP
jgi:thiol-disulfide isomerase/thioredoxin